MPLQIVVPMAGEGQRYRDAGFTTPKPLIPVAGVPMVIRAVKDLPPAERVVFLVRSEHITEYRIDEALQRDCPGCRVVPVEGLTAGQACTVRLAAESLEPDWPVIVAACDNSHLYDQDELLRQMADPQIECLVWTYRGEPRVAINPQQYGWVRVEDGRVREVSCKQPVSDAPLGDHVVSGFFSFRSAGQMITSIDRMIEENLRVNDEFYMDVVPNVMLAEGLGVGLFEVEKYIGWGTPEDLREFERWERYCARLR